MLEKKITYDHNITELRNIQVRRITRIMEDGVEISKSYHRDNLSPGDSVMGQDEVSIAISQVLWTPEVIASYKEVIARSI